ncbi:MAG: 2-oxoacid:acceptor oxidoreductase family protein [candidate division WOR-3 bacterium]
MKKDKIEIVWFGRGGMGVKTAALLFGEAFVHKGKFVQAFPEYGPERRGAPLFAFTRISEYEIKGHYGIKDPDIVVIIDPRLLKTENFKNFIKNNTILLINTNVNPEDLKKILNLKSEIKTIDATGISRRIFGRDMPNAPLLGALLKITGFLTLEEFINFVKERLKNKYEEKIVNKNIEAIKLAYKEVKG